MSEARLWALAVVCFAAAAMLGAYVSGRPPLRLDVEAIALCGEATTLAAIFTALGRWYVLVPLGLLVTAAAIVLRADVRLAIALFASQLASQGAVSLIKPIFHRQRPDYWLVTDERGFSYPSGHAVTTVVVYVALLLIVLRWHVLPRPATVPCAVILIACIAGIPWSRLALGAHYFSDVAGGLLFGCGWLCASLALAQRVAANVRISP